MKLKLSICLVTMFVGIGFSYLLTPNNQTVGEKLFPFHLSNSDIVDSIGKKVVNICQNSDEVDKITNYVEVYPGRYAVVVTPVDKPFSPTFLNRYEQRVCLKYVD